MSVSAFQNVPTIYSIEMESNIDLIKNEKTRMVILILKFDIKNNN